MKIEGNVFSGMNVAEEYLGMKQYQRKIKNITGFKPFPGTLNLRSNEEKVKNALNQVDSVRISSFSFEGKKYSGIDVYPATVQGHDAAVLRMDVTDYGPEVVEIAAKDKLRETLGIEDGDKVKVDLDDTFHDD
ncbi:MAG: transcriptional regulator of a riboflavin/FAD biosynthetic operon [Candidatus Nanosalina sp. J07AB43]|nr:MAG: transcriptional regulator of a riboflavin/FAD biosynthetic operon [Candidatus Nanosalina sp. J07AB43]